MAKQDSRFGKATARRWVLWLAVLSIPLPLSDLSMTEERGEGGVEHGFRVTGGAAAGYIEDRACALCHSGLFESYQEVGMARSFARPQNAEAIEDLDAAPYYHRASNRYYQMKRSEDGGLLMARWQRGEEGQRVSYIEQKVDWVLGSGHTSRVYLYRTPSGELFQLPISWYSQGQGWGMAPGFDWPVHEGISRRVRRECMFCHNAYPDMPAGSDLYGAPQVFPEELPEGTGCQRCHGPGAEHVARVFGGQHDVDGIREAIVNPAYFEPERRNQVCNSCHMQPTVELMGVRRFERADYSQRPGDDLADYLVLLDAEAKDQERGERFEINHHPYRLEQSRCFQESADLSCLTCHNPHRKVPVAQRAAHYRQACLSCHQLEACGKTAAAVAENFAGESADGTVESLDCVSCHMPRRRTQDVIHVAMTDHRIQKYVDDRDLLAPLEERDPTLVGLSFLRADSAPKGAVGEIYKVAAVLRAGAGSDAADRLESLLLSTAAQDLPPWLDLARARVQQRQWPGARRALDKLTELLPKSHPARGSYLGWRAMLAAAEGRLDEASKLFRQALELRDDPSLLYNFGVVLAADDRLDEAAASLRRSVELRPNNLAPLFYLARVERARERPAEAMAWLHRALAVDPGHGDSYLLLGRLLEEANRPKEAQAMLRRGLILARENDQLQAALATGGP